MISSRVERALGASLSLAAILCGCSPPEEEAAGEDPAAAATTGALVTQQVNDQGGFRATVSLISNFDGVGGWPNGTGTNTVRVAACDGFVRENGTAGAQLYVATGTPSARRLYVTNDAARDYGTGNPNVATGTTWQEIPSGLAVPGTNQIGCDGHYLYALNASNVLYQAGTNSGGTFSPMRRSNGTFDTWSVLGTNSQFTDLQSGAGNLYIVGLGTNALYTQDSTTPGVVKTSPGLLRDTLRVTGAGKASLATLAATAGNRFSGSKPPNRAFTIKTDGTLWFNDRVLSSPTGTSWIPLDFGAARFEDISASAPDVLWAVTNSGGMRHLHEIRFTETSCGDGADNDADSLTDGQDPDCMGPLAASYCPGKTTGFYCSSRFTNTSDFLVRCQGGAVSSLTRGRCIQGGSLGTDAMSATNIPEPSSMNRWCSVVWRPSGRWSVETEATPGVSNGDVCGHITANPPLAGQTAEITGAGLYSISGVNTVVGFCEDGHGAGWVNMNRINGTAPIDDVVALLRSVNASRCKLLISPANLPIFDLPYDSVAVSQLGAGIGYGGVFNPDGHAAWDIGMPEGVPLLAVADGVVVGVVTDPVLGQHSGSEDLDLSGLGAVGDSHQSGILIRHVVQSGTSGRYRESFVSVYNHMRQRIVQAGQVVKKGQIIGYNGQMGQAFGPHVHFGVVRLSNTVLSVIDTNPSTVVVFDPWPIRPEVTLKSGVSPFGWRGTGQDPWGAHHVAEGKGAFSPKLWSSSGQTPSPAPAVTALGW